LQHVTWHRIVLIVGREGLSDFFQATTPPADPWRDGAKAMEENRMNTVDLGEIVGGSGQASMILREKRESPRQTFTSTSAPRYSSDTRVCEYTCRRRDQALETCPLMKSDPAQQTAAGRSSRPAAAVRGEF
jgi:hypothetical protein